MAGNTLNTNYSEGDDVLSSHNKQYAVNRNGEFLPYLNNVPTAGQLLGNSLYPWGPISTSGLIIDGKPVDLSKLSTDRNRIISGRTRAANSSYPSFFTYDDDSLILKILCADTPLSLSIDGESVVYNQDIDVEIQEGFPDDSLSVTINSEGLSNDEYAGLADCVYGNSVLGVILVDGVSSTTESFFLNRRHGLKTSELGVMMAYMYSNRVLSNIEKFDVFTSQGHTSPPIPLSDNDVLKLVRTGWVMMDADTSVAPEVTYREPVESFTAPNNPNEGEYWKDLASNTWRRRTSQDWVKVKKIPIGIVFSEGTGSNAKIIGYKCFQFDNPNPSNLNGLLLDRLGDKSLILYQSAIINIAGVNHFLKHINFTLNNAPNGINYIYINEDLSLFFSGWRPSYRNKWGGLYFPWSNARCIGRVHITNNVFTSRHWFNDVVSIRYNSFIQLPTEFQSLGQPNRFVNRSPFLSPRTFTAGANGYTQFNFKTGAFTEAPDVIAVPPNNTSSSQFSPVLINYDSKTKDRARIQLGNVIDGYAAIELNEKNVFVKPAGNDLLQRIIDNTLK